MGIEDTKQLKILSAIARIHHSVGASLEVEEIAQIIIDELVEIVGCDAAAIMLIRGQTVDVIAEKGFKKTFANGVCHVDLPVIQHIINTKEGIYTNDIASSPAAACVPSGCTMNSLIFTPITIDGEVAGMIFLASGQHDIITDEDLQFVQRLVKEISIIFKRSFQFSKVKFLSIRDVLTGSFNRRKFDEDIVVELDRAKRYGRDLSLLMLDIDWFKRYNDLYGHQKGDAVLKQLVHVLTCNLRSSDRIYRYGGEEFAILAPETNKEEGQKLACKLQKIIEQERFVDEEQSQPGQKLTISVGVAGFPIDAEEPEALVAAADRALYEAKQTGKNKVCVYNAEYNS
ncbi:MAG: GGDEF domain-containing protein [Thermoanaerobacteraceae bacterium]|nr:GGDEF domain-containing protein [Thermoanaerobacteraceae bacterium]